MRIQPVTGYHPAFTDGAQNRVSSEKELKKPATLSDLYKESDNIQKKIDEQNKLIMSAIMARSKYLVDPTPKKFEEMKYELINLGTSGYADKIFNGG
jgi:hypothetical protein